MKAPEFRLQDSSCEGAWSEIVKLLCEVTWTQISDAFKVAKLKCEDAWIQPRNNKFATK